MTLDNKNKPKRLFIYTKDVMRITGKGRGASINLINKIRNKNNKPTNSNITVMEFCEFAGLNLDEVNLYL